MVCLSKIVCVDIEAPILSLRLSPSLSSLVSPSPVLTHCQLQVPGLASDKAQSQNALIK